MPSATPAASPAGPRTGLGGGLAVVFVALFGALLASFPARNPDVWGHLAAGRDLAGGAVAAVTPNWLYDLTTYLVYRLGGGAALVGAKALAVAALGMVMLLAARRVGRGWALPVVCVGLAVLAAGTRLQLQPATASYLFLAVTVWLLRDEGDGPSSVWPGWRLAVLFLVWANVDAGVVFGLGVVALTWLGRSLDGRGAGLGRRLGALAVLAGVCLLNPAHVRLFAPLAEVVPAVRAAVAGPADAPRPFPSPFDRAVLESYRQVPAGLAFYLLLGVGLVSFLAAGRRGAWRWGRFLPWFGLAIAAAVQARAVPFFAVLAGPVLAWNLQDVFAARPPMPRRSGVVLGLFGVVVGAAFLAAAWPGWLQRPPFGARRWAVEEPAGLKAAAAFVRESPWPAGTRTLHLTADSGSSDTAAAFAWFAPDDPRLVDDDLTGLLLADADPAGRLRAAGVGRVVVSVADRGRPERVLRRLLQELERWPLLSVRGGVAVFGWRDPARADNPYRGREIDFDRLGFRPAEDERAPEARPVRRGDHWSDAFRRPVPVRTGDADEASLLLVQAEALRRTAPARKLAGWEASEVGGLVAAAAGWAGPNGLADAG
ncbi:MAG: hypothetical protein K2X82_05345, partial [Gemmataceae bacterium]|nr:hypothetical protein [Gemmataceae bacterium]